MTFPEESLAGRFDQMVESVVAMAGAVDVERALTEGRRAVRRRHTRAVLSGAGAISVAAALVAVSALASGPAPVAAGPTAPAGPVDPLHSFAEFGWMPTTLTGRAYTEANSDGMAVTSAYDPQTVGTSEVSTEVDLITSPNGSQKLLGDQTDFTKTQLGMLNGQAVEMYSKASDPSTFSTLGGLAVWPSCASIDGTAGPYGPLTQQGVSSNGDVEIVWRTPSGAAAEIDYHYVNQAPPDGATMLHMAESVTFAKMPLPMPFSVNGFAGATVADAEQGNFHDSHPAASSVALQQDGVVVQIYSDWPTGQSIGCGPFPPTGQYAARVINGVEVYVILSPANPNAKIGAKIFALGTASQILDRITGFGKNPADWTEDVIQPG